MAPLQDTTSQEGRLSQDTKEPELLSNDMIRNILDGAERFMKNGAKVMSLLNFGMEETSSRCPGVLMVDQIRIQQLENVIEHQKLQASSLDMEKVLDSVRIRTCVHFVDEILAQTQAMENKLRDAAAAAEDPTPHLKSIQVRRDLVTRAMVLRHKELNEAADEFMQ